MTVSEFINFWDSVNITTIPISYLYKNKEISKFELHKIMDNLDTLKIKYSFEELKEEHISIYNSELPYDEFNNAQLNFYNNIKLELPESSNVFCLKLYIN